MTFVHKTGGTPASVAILAGAFNPPTTAHLAIAGAALNVVDEVLLALPRRLPHKQFDGASLDQRVLMLERLAREYPNVSAATADGGLFAEIAREARAHYPTAEIHLLCGRDAAERILGWDYDDPEFVERMMQEFRLLVAPRSGEYVAPDRFREKIRSICPGDYDEFSSTRVREAIQSGENWRWLVPDAIADLVEQIYR